MKLNPMAKKSMRSPDCDGHTKMYFLVLTMTGKSAASTCSQVSISPTFYEQLLRQNPLAKKLQTQIVSI
jgi:hypothetical protein